MNIIAGHIIIYLHSQRMWIITITILTSRAEFDPPFEQSIPVYHLLTEMLALQRTKPPRLDEQGQVYFGLFITKSENMERFI